MSLFCLKFKAILAPGFGLQVNELFLTASKKGLQQAAQIKSVAACIVPLLCIDWFITYEDMFHLCQPVLLLLNITFLKVYRIENTLKLCSDL